MQTVRACCRVLAACAAAFFSFSLEAAPTEHLVYPTPQNLSAKIEIYQDADVQNIYLGEWSETVRASDTWDSFAFTGGAWA